MPDEEPPPLRNTWVYRFLEDFAGEYVLVVVAGLDLFPLKFTDHELELLWSRRLNEGLQKRKLPKISGVGVAFFSVILFVFIIASIFDWLAANAHPILKAYPIIFSVSGLQVSALFYILQYIPYLRDRLEASIYGLLLLANAFVGIWTVCAASVLNKDGRARGFDYEETAPQTDVEAAVQDHVSIVIVNFAQTMVICLTFIICFLYIPGRTSKLLPFAGLLSVCLIATRVTAALYLPAQLRPEVFVVLIILLVAVAFALFGRWLNEIRVRAAQLMVLEGADRVRKLQQRMQEGTSTTTSALEELALRLCNAIDIMKKLVKTGSNANSLARALQFTEAVYSRVVGGGDLLAATTQGEDKIDGDAERQFVDVFRVESAVKRRQNLPSSDVRAAGSVGSSGSGARGNLDATVTDTVVTDSNVAQVERACVEYEYDWNRIRAIQQWVGKDAGVDFLAHLKSHGSKTAENPIIEIGVALLMPLMQELHDSAPDVLSWDFELSNITTNILAAFQVFTPSTTAPAYNVYSAAMSAHTGVSLLRMTKVWDRLPIQYRIVFVLVCLGRYVGHSGRTPNYMYKMNNLVSSIYLNDSPHENFTAHLLIRILTFDSTTQLIDLLQTCLPDVHPSKSSRLREEIISHRSLSPARKMEVLNIPGYTDARQHAYTESSDEEYSLYDDETEDQTESGPMTQVERRSARKGALKAGRQSSRTDDLYGLIRYWILSLDVRKHFVVLSENRLLRQSVKGRDWLKKYFPLLVLKLSDAPYFQKWECQLHHINLIQTQFFLQYREEISLTGCLSESMTETVKAESSQADSAQADSAQADSARKGRSDAEAAAIRTGEICDHKLPEHKQGIRQKYSFSPKHQSQYLKFIFDPLVHEFQLTLAEFQESSQKHGFQPLSLFLGSAAYKQYIENKDRWERLAHDGTELAMETLRAHLPPPQFGVWVAARLWRSRNLGEAINKPNDAEG